MTSTTEGSLVAEIRRLAGERKELLSGVEDVNDRLALAVAELAKIGVPETRLAELAGVSRNTIRTWVGKADWSELWAGRRESGRD